MFGPISSPFSIEAGYDKIGTLSFLHSSYCARTNICKQYVHNIPINIVDIVPKINPEL